MASRSARSVRWLRTSSAKGAVDCGDSIVAATASRLRPVEGVANVLFEHGGATCFIDAGEGAAPLTLSKLLHAPLALRISVHGKTRDTFSAVDVITAKRDGAVFE